MIGWLYVVIVNEPKLNKWAWQVWPSLIICEGSPWWQESVSLQWKNVGVMDAESGDDLVDDLTDVSGSDVTGET